MHCITAAEVWSSRGQSWELWGYPCPIQTDGPDSPLNYLTVAYWPTAESVEASDTVQIQQARGLVEG